jgi:hypothetical protein
MKSFEPLDLKHRKRVEELLNRFPQVTSELTFTSLLAWKDARLTSVLEIGDSIVLISKKDKGLALFGPPLGPLSITDALEVVQAKTEIPVIACERIPEEIALSIDASQAEIMEDRNNFDYVYYNNDLAELKGRKYHKKRNLIAQCLGNYRCTYEEITHEIIPEIKEMQDRWCAQRNCENIPLLCHEYKAINNILDNAEELDIIGGAIRIDGTVQAYTIASALNKNTAAIHFEKAMPEFKGLYQLINQWFCQNSLASFKFVNREQDVGIGGIRRAKESYFPDHMIRKYAVLHNISREEYEKLRTREAHCE